MIYEIRENEEKPLMVKFIAYFLSVYLPDSYEFLIYSR